MNRYSRSIHTFSRCLGHENPLGLKSRSPQTMSKGLPIRQRIPGVNKILLVASGKGGVGKSTVSVNVALSLQSLGLKVGLLDADIFGPSIPKLMNLSGEPRVTTEGKLKPLTNYGLKTMSMGYLIPTESSAIVWRGLMVMKALQQLLFEIEWEDLDVLVIDTPPGTGDTHLTLSQQLKVDGAVVVSTPQDIALTDARKGITMFNKVKIPVLGLVQNMSYYLCPNCNHESHIFGTDGVLREAKKHNTDLLGEVPLNEIICNQSDLGKPVVISHPGSELSKPYTLIAEKIKLKLFQSVKFI